MPGVYGRRPKNENKWERRLIAVLRHRQEPFGEW